MNEIILQLTHDNNLFEEQWSDTFTRIEEASIPNDSKVVLNALADYVLSEPMDPAPADVKYLLISMVIKQLVKNEACIEINELVNIFTRVLDASRTDQWYLHFLQTIYRDFNIGEQLRSLPLKANLIEQILRSLQNKIFIFNSKEHGEKWQTFLTKYVFSNSADNNNILNKQNIITNMQIVFQQFYKHAVQQSQKSCVWLNIATTLNESSSEIFDNNTKADEISSYANLSIENIDSMIEAFILANKYDEAHRLVSQLIDSNLEALLQTIIRLCSLVENRDLFCSKILVSLISNLEYLPVKQNLAVLFFDLIVAILKLRVLDAPNLSHRLLKRDDFYPWKELINGIVDLLKACISYDIIIQEEHFSKLNDLENITDLISRKARVYPIISQTIHPIAVEAILRWSNTKFNGSNYVYRMGRSIFNLIDLQQINEDTCLKFIDALQNRVNCDNEEINTKTRPFFNDMSKYLGDFIVQLQRLSHNIHSKLANLFLSLLDHSLYDEGQTMSFEHVALACNLFKTASSIFNEKDARLYEPCLNRMYDDAKNDEKTILYQWWVGFWCIIGTKLPNVAVNHIERFCDYTFTRKNMSLTGVLLTLYVQNPKLCYTRFDDLIKTLLSDDGQYLTSLIGLFSFIVRQYPEIISSKHIHQIFSSVETLPFNTSFCLLFQTLSSVANYQPYLFDDYRDKLISLIIEKQNLLIFECFRKYIISSMIMNDRNNANEYLNLLIDLLKNGKCSDDIQKEIFYTCLLIGVKYKQILINRRADLATLGSSLLLNYIDDNTNSKIDQATIKRAQQEIERTELCIEKSKMDNKENQINASYVPSWGREVTKLLNRRSDNDWRLLGKQLGFSSSEIKHWAMQTDPSMALLNEWFLTHKTEEATYSLIKGLGEIDRHDVERIIRQAVLVTGQIIPNDPSIGLKRLLPVFLSFHSSEQTLVVKLKDHLKDAGYACQMYDEQVQMDIIKTHIHGAKVVICCTNTLYTQSENCSKAFHLILNIKKPFILLYTEEQVWSPQSTHKSDLSDYLYIQFCTDKKTDHWPENKFIEILGQIRYHVAPDPDMIREQYRHWFVPRLNNLIFLKSSNEQRECDFISFNDIPLVVFHPQIIISYQWDCQRDVLSLYKQLTQLGYRIWLDIFQMGGGDSLLEKYNIVIRQSLCLLVCITPKYMKSINCQHEISLANALNKPIIPLLLEETNTWPPSNIILSMFAGKSYIDFPYTDRWTGKQFEMLLAQLKLIVPNIHTDKPRHLIEMQRPISASRNNDNTDQRPKRISSAPIIPKSRACTLM